MIPTIKKDIKMRLFRKEKISNDYYEAYKVELGINKEVEENKFFSLDNFLKLELIAVAIGFIILNQDSILLKLKKIYTADSSNLPISRQYASLDEELVVREESSLNLEKIEIREDDIVADDISDDEIFVNNRDIQLLLELLKTEIQDTSDIES